MNKDVVFLTDAGQIGMAIVRRTGFGKKIIIGDKSAANAEAISKIMNDAGFDTVPMEMDPSSRESIEAANLKQENELADHQFGAVKSAFGSKPVLYGLRFLFGQGTINACGQYHVLAVVSRKRSAAAAVQLCKYCRSLFR